MDLEHLHLEWLDHLRASTADQRDSPHHVAACSGKKKNIWGLYLVSHSAEGDREQMWVPVGLCHKTASLGSQVSHPLWRYHPVSQSPGVTWLIAKAEPWPSPDSQVQKCTERAQKFQLIFPLEPCYTLSKLRVRRISICFLSGFCALKATDHNEKKQKKTLKQAKY